MECTHLIAKAVASQLVHSYQGVFTHRQKMRKGVHAQGPHSVPFCIYIYIHMYACLSPGWTVVSLSSDSLPILPRGLRQPGLPEPHSHRSQSATSLHVNSSGDDRQVWVLGFTLAVLPWKSNLRRSGRRLWHLGNPQQ